MINFQGIITVENIGMVFGKATELFVGKKFTFTTLKEQFGPRINIETSMELEQERGKYIDIKMYAEDHAQAIIYTSDGVFFVPTHNREQDVGGIQLPYIILSNETLNIMHRLDSGMIVHWNWIIEGGTVLVSNCRTCRHDCEVLVRGGCHYEPISQ